MRVVVTGGAGFIGANLARQLLSSGDQVVILDDFSTSKRSNLEGLDVELIEASVLDARAVGRAVSGADSVVHLAALASVPQSIEDPMGTNDVNVTGTLRVLNAARNAGVRHVIFASSSAVYGANPELPKHEGLRAEPLSPYAASKLAAESYALAFAHCYDVAVLAFRFFNVFGPLQPAGHVYAAVVPAFIDAALNGRALTLYGDGSQTRDFTFVGSLVRVLADAVHRRVSSLEPVNLAFGSRTSLRELIALLEQELVHKIDVELLAPRPGDVPHSQADASMLTALFPDIEPIALEAGLHQTVEWFRSVTTAR